MPIKQTDDLSSLTLAVSTHDGELLRQSLNKAIAAGNSFAAIRSAITNGIGNIRQQIMSKDKSIPDFLLSIDTMSWVPGESIFSHRPVNFHPMRLWKMRWQL